MSMQTANQGPRSLAWVALFVLGLGLLAVAWMLPANVKSLNPALLREAGRDTPSVSVFSRDLLALDKSGPAALVLEAARLVKNPEAGAVGVIFDDFQKKHREMVPWGGWDVALDPLLSGQNPAPTNASTPVLTFMVTERSRDNLRKYLEVSRQPGVQTLLKTADLTGTKRFVPARRPGGQPLDAVILLTTYLWQSEHLAPSLQREVREQAEAAVTTGQMGPLEDFYIDILTLGKKLNWVQLSDLLRTATSTATVAQFAHLTRVAPEHLPIIYTAALMANSADGVARYLITHGKPGIEYLQQAIAFNQGAVEQLVLRQVPVTNRVGIEYEFGASFALQKPELALLVKYAAFLAGLFLLFRSVDLRMFARIESALPGAFPRMGSSVLAVILTFIFFVFSEPFLLKAAASTDYQVKLFIPVLGQTAGAAHPISPTTSMETKTLLSISVFALLQVGMYIICLLRISDVARQPLAAAVKLKLMDNEENLFDSGLYIGIAGTATALVLQVLGLIEANLLAAYSSNLFGIVCVALVKIRHVRPYKRKLILEAQEVPVASYSSASVKA